MNTAVFGGWPQALLAYPRMYAALLLWALLLLPVVGERVASLTIHNSLDKTRTNTDERGR